MRAPAEEPWIPFEDSSGGSVSFTLAQAGIPLRFTDRDRSIAVMSGDVVVYPFEVPSSAVWAVEAVSVLLFSTGPLLIERVVELLRGGEDNPQLQAEVAAAALRGWKTLPGGHDRGWVRDEPFGGEWSEP